MNIYSSKRRFLLASGACVSLIALYWIFRLSTSPFLEVERRSRREVSRPQVSVAEFRREAAEWFPEYSWVPNALKHFRDQGRYLFCNQFDLDKSRSRIDASPVAIMWKSEDDDEVPIRLVASSAQLLSDRKLVSKNTEIGEISAASLSGNVVIRGPNNLWIRGQSFQLDSESMKLWSGEPVQFRWETHQGTAHSGIEVQLRSAVDGGGLTEISEVTKIQLLGLVTCDVFVPAARRGEDPIDLTIRAPNGFEYEVPLKKATFSGRPASDLTRKLNLNDDVTVDRRTTTGGVDKLICPELELQFQDEVDESGEPTGQLTLSMAQAWGRKIYFISPENRLKMLANRLRYYVSRRQLQIETASVQGRSDMLRIRQEGTDIVLPPTQPGDAAQVRVLHDPDGTIRDVLITVPNSQQYPGERPGKITSHGLPSESRIESSDDEDFSLAMEWGDSLHLQLAPDDMTRILTLNGGCRVAEEDRNFALSAQEIAMRLKSDPKTEQSVTRLDTPGATGLFKPASDATLLPNADEKSSMNLSSLMPELLVAVGDVSLDSSQGQGELREKLTVSFLRNDNLQITDPKSQSSDDAFRVNGEASPDGESISFISDTLNARVEINGEREMKFRDVWLNGDVQIARHSDKDEDRFTASGNQLHAFNGLTDQREIQLFGDPARVIRPTGQSKLEGPRIDLNELDKMATVVGNGTIRFMTDKGIDGRKLRRPAPIDIFWSDRMEFQKKSARFVGNIRVTMVDETQQEVELKCAGLTVHFSEDVSLGARDKDGGFATFMSEDSSGGKKNGRIERIECHNKVVVNVEQHAGSVRSGRHFASFADLEVNLQTGDFSAVGPGMIESVSPDKDGRLQGASPVTARANAPAQTTETAFVYMQIDFIGELNGNLQHKEAELTHNVVALVTPARHVDEKIDLQIVSTENLPVKAGILRAQRLSIDGLDRPDSGAAAFSLVARQHARLESRTITARADVIVYDHSKQQFIMQADGEGRVAVNHRSGPRGLFNRFYGKRFEYYRHSNELRGDRINGLDVTE